MRLRSTSMASSTPPFKVTASGCAPPVPFLHRQPDRLVARPPRDRDCSSGSAGRPPAASLCSSIECRVVRGSWVPSLSSYLLHHRRGTEKRRRYLERILRVLGYCLLHAGNS